jgi:hypothetical protein
MSLINQWTEGSVAGKALRVSALLSVIKEAGMKLAAGA